MLRIFRCLLLIFWLFDNSFGLIVVDLIDILRVICRHFFFDIHSICCQHLFAWLSDDDCWSSLLLIYIFRALIVNSLIFDCTSLHRRLYFLNLLMNFIEYSMLLHPILRTCDNFSIGFFSEKMVDLIKIIHDAIDRNYYLRLIPCKMILK